jgi:membrane AbrB-like protein
MSLSPVAATAALIAAGAAGGALASVVHVPMPWLIGSLAMGIVFARFGAGALPESYKFPQRFRFVFIAMIGMTIGFQVHPDLLEKIPSLVASLIAITLFVPLAQGANYWIFRSAGGYDRPTAFFAGSPGGLMEAIALGEASGADVRLLTLQQFLRIIVVITAIPLGISLWVGHPVGSAAGLANQLPLSEIPECITVAISVPAGALGLWLGLRLHFPAGQFVGPLVAAAALNLSGLPQLAMPVWAVVAAQVVIGASLGIRFLGLSARMVWRGIWLAVLSVAAMLGIGAAMSLVLVRLTELHFDVLFISFAPGGVTEMGLIAISLAASPAVVALHHLYRIVLTVLAMALIARRLT